MKYFLILLIFVGSAMLAPNAFGLCDSLPCDDLVIQSEEYLSPLKQIKTGTYGNDIQCRDERVLVLKKSSEMYSCIQPETVPKLFARDWALNEVEIIDTGIAEQGSKLVKITGIIDRLSTPEGFEYHLIPLHEELPKIEYTGYETLNLFSTKDTIHYFIRNLEESLVKIEGRFLLEDGEYFRHFSGLPTIPVQKLEIISEPETTLEEVQDICANDSPKERMANPLRHSNGTHVFLNLGCEWKVIGVYLGD